MIINFFPNAKINIGLYVVEKRPDGYHNLETIFYPLPLCDELIVEEQNGLNHSCVLEVEGISVTTHPEDNLIVKAYRLLEKDFSLGNTAVYLRMPCNWEPIVLFLFVISLFLPPESVISFNLYNYR